METLSKLLALWPFYKGGPRTGWPVKKEKQKYLHVFQNLCHWLIICDAICDKNSSKWHFRFSKYVSPLCVQICVHVYYYIARCIGKVHLVRQSTIKNGKYEALRPSGSPYCHLLPHPASRPEPILVIHGSSLETMCYCQSTEFNPSPDPADKLSDYTQTSSE